MTVDVGWYRLILCRNEVVLLTIKVVSALTMLTTCTYTSQ